jgi:transposase
VPEEIPDADHELVMERVCAVDVAKASGVVCVRTPRERRRVSKVWDVEATTGGVSDLADQLMELGVEKVTVESTSDYWRIWFYLLEAAGLDVQLVNARDVKNVPGRPKTDKLDAVWLAKLTEKGLLRPSFVPPAPIRQLRDYTRLRVDLTRERSRYWQRLEKLLEDALIKLSSVASTLNTLSARDMIEALIAGQRDPRRLADLARGRMQTKRSALIKALDGRFDDHHAELARILLDQIDTLSAQIATLTARIDHLLEQDDPDDAGGGSVTAQAVAAPTRPSAVERLTEIPGIGQTGAQIILAEIGLDMTQFPTAAHLVSWAKLCPRTVQSGPIRRGGKTGKGNPYLKGALGEAAANSKPWSRSPDPSSSSSGTCSPTRSPASATWDPTTTTASSTPNAGCATTSPNSPRWATTSPSNSPHNPNTQPHNLTRLASSAGWSRLPTQLGIFRSASRAASLGRRGGGKMGPRSSGTP